MEIRTISTRCYHQMEICWGVVEVSHPGGAKILGVSLRNRYYKLIYKCVDEFRWKFTEECRPRTDLLQALGIGLDDAVMR